MIKKTVVKIYEDLWLGLDTISLKESISSLRGAYFRGRTKYYKGYRNVDNISRFFSWCRKVGKELKTTVDGLNDCW